MHADCVFSDFTGWTAVRTERGSSVSFLNCVFANNTLVPQVAGAAVLMQDAWVVGDTRANATGPFMRVEGCATAVFCAQGIACSSGKGFRDGYLQVASLLLLTHVTWWLQVHVHRQPADSSPRAPDRPQGRA